MPFVAEVRDFIELGGLVIWAVFLTCLLMWTVIVERIWFFRIIYPRFSRKVVSEWQTRDDRFSWYALKIRQAIISEVSMKLHSRLVLIKTLIVLCPLLGLLGTVTGMVNVFEVIASSGNSDVQSMARGIYRATIPTMSGLVVALSGYYFSSRLSQVADKLTSKLVDQMALA